MIDFLLIVFVFPVEFAGADLQLICFSFGL